MAKDFKRRLNRLEKILKPKHNRWWYQHSPLSSVSSCLRNWYDISYEEIDSISNDEFFAAFPIQPLPSFVGRDEISYEDDRRVEQAIIDIVQAYAPEDIEITLGMALGFITTVIATHIKGEDYVKTKDKAREDREKVEAEKAEKSRTRFFRDGRLVDSYGQPVDESRLANRLVILPPQIDEDSPEDESILPEDESMPEVSTNVETSTEAPKKVREESPRELTEDELRERQKALEKIYRDLENYWRF